MTPAGAESPLPVVHRLILVRHAHSQVEPSRPPREWGLSESGRRGAARLAALALFERAAGFYAGPEPKLHQTLAPVATGNGNTVQLDDDYAETASEGWLGEDAFRETVRRFFDDLEAPPAPGWEPAGVARKRFQGAVERGMARHGTVVSGGHARPGTFAIASGGRMLTAYLAGLLGEGAEEAFRRWQALRMPDVAVVELQPAVAPRLVIPFGTLTV